ncbi:MAG: D-tyrosyl-tRNA(Tyr) deacylase [Actinobacteria bacterium]|nr:MAG: D-tyrosyl-tRNA(Tyr) deacylase [Actinomycetota bacterium]
MRALVQRVHRARVVVGSDVRGEIGPGLCVLVGVTHTDDGAAARRLAEKVWYLRILGGADGQMDSSLADVGGSVLVVSQFTLYADTTRGRRPSWAAAAPAERAEPLVTAFGEALAELGARVETGTFGAMMDVELVNHGPVTVLLEVEGCG